LTKAGGFVAVRPGVVDTPVVDRFTPQGALDPTFGDGGEASGLPGAIRYNSGGQMVVQADDRIVVCTTIFGDAGTGESIAVGRFNADGSLDTSFGTKATSFPGYQVEARAIALAPDGSIVVAVALTSNTAASSVFGVARYTPTGALDTSFGGGKGFAMTTLTTSKPVAEAVAVDRYGRILLGGTSGANFAVVRYWP
jgi:uncharacterized delta-60 repeat protein